MTMEQPRRIRRWLALLLLLFVGHAERLFAVDDMQTLPPEGRSAAFYSRVAQDAELPTVPRGKTLPQYPTLKIGVLSCSDSPLLMWRWDGKIEGIYADYLRLLEIMLKRSVELRLYGNWAQANDALQQGKIQLLIQSSSSLISRTSQKNPILVQPYALMVRNANVNTKPAEMTIMVASDISAEDVIRLQTYYRRVEVAKSQQAAIKAVAEGEVDGYLDGQLQIANLEAFHPVSGLVYRREESMGEQFHWFSGRPDAGVENSISAILATIPHTIKNEIYQRWISGLALGNNNAAPRFLPQEENWMRQHSVINVAINSMAPPYSFLNKNNELIGLDVDVMRLLGEKNGLHFNFIPADGLPAVKALLKAGKAQMTPSLAATTQRRGWLNFSQPIGTIEWVMITRNEHSAPYTFDQLKHLRVAILHDHALLATIRQHPDVAVVLVNTMDQAIQMVLAGAVDATFDSLGSANYQLASRYGSRLVIQALKNAHQPELYAVLPNYPQLLTILNKSIEALGPDELRMLRLRWLSVANIVTNSDDKISPWVLVWFGVLFIVALSSVFWGSYLAHQIRLRQKAEGRLQALLSDWEILFNNMPTPMFICDPTMRITAANLYFRREFGHPDTPVVGQTLPELCFLSPQDEKELSLVFLRCLAGEPAHFSDRRIVIKGQGKEVYLWLEGYNNTTGVSPGIIGGWFDVTERKLLARELRHERDKAENASQEKSAFLARMSHEIRTPLHAIIGILDLEVHKKVSSPQLQIAWQAAMSLQGVIGDVLDFSRIESGRMTLHLQPASLTETLENCVATFTQRATEKGLTFCQQLNLPSGVNYELDVTVVTQIINNLLSNSIKFTDKGGMELRADCREWVTSKHDEVTLTVTDSGCGIPQEMHQAVLQPYVQAGHHHTGKAGSGLGLSISARLTELMGGALSIEHAPKGGTRVKAVLPLTRSHAQRPMEAEWPVLMESLNILLVDDSAANLQVLALQLDASGHQVTLAESGERALQLMNQVYFDMVLTDCQMPRMNGYTLARRLRQIEQERQLPPLLILGCTANAFVAEKDLCLEAGMNGVLIKPMTQRKLLSEINHYYRQATEEDSLHFYELQALAQHDCSQEIKLLLALRHGVEEDIAVLKNNSSSSQLLVRCAHRLQGAFALLNYRAGIRVCLRIDKGGRCDAQTLALLLSRTEEFLQVLWQRMSELGEEET